MLQEKAFLSLCINNILRFDIKGSFLLLLSFIMTVLVRKLIYKKTLTATFKHF